MVTGKRLVTMLVIAGACTAATSYLFGAAKAAPEAGPGTKVAVIDLVKVFNEFEQTKVVNQKMAEHRSKLGAEDDRRSQEINAKKTALDGFTPDTADWHKRNKELQDLRFSYRVWQLTEQDGLAERHLTWVKRTYKMVTDEVAKIAQAHGVQLVVTREELDMPTNTDTKTMLEAMFRQILSRKVVYSDPAIDLSNEVLGNLNTAFEKAGGAKSVDVTK